MKKTLALILVLVLALGCLTGCGGKKEEVTVLKFACSAGETSTWVEAAKYFGDMLTEKTGGKFVVEYYPSDQLTAGSQNDGIQACMDGTTELSMHSNLIYSSFDDRFSVVSLPYLFDTIEEADEVLDGAGGDALQGVLGEYGLHCMGIAENGFRHVTNSKRPIIHPEDMKDLVIRVAGSSVLMEAYGAWGANYTKANWSEVYTGLQTGTYDGQENPVPTMDSASVQEVQSYCTYWTGSYDCLFFVINDALYQSFDDATKAIFDECGQAACEYQREINRAGDADILARWEAENGVEVHYQTPEEAAEFKALSEGVNQFYADLLIEGGRDEASVKEFLAAFGVTL